MNVSAIVPSMALCILLGSCAILDELVTVAPDDLSDGKYCAILVGWGFFVAGAVGVAAAGF